MDSYLKIHVRKKDESSVSRHRKNYLFVFINSLERNYFCVLLSAFFFPALIGNVVELLKSPDEEVITGQAVCFW